MKSSNESPASIAILNMWWTPNYGANLTALALQRAIGEFGYTSDLVHFPHSRCAEDGYEGSVFEEFATKELSTTSLLPHDKDLSTLNEQYSTFIVGSDQVWRARYTEGMNYPYFLRFADFDKKLIAYAASFGVSEWEWAESSRSMQGCLLRRFDAISVREQDGVALCQDKLSAHAQWVLDPVFFYDASWWQSYAEQAQELLPERYIASYILDMTDDIRESLESAFGLPLINVSDYNGRKASIYFWLKAISHSHAFVTDSYHGVCFALIFSRPFAVFANRERGYARFESLLSSCGLMDRIVEVSDRVSLLKALETPLDRERISDSMAPRYNESRRFLQEALQKPCCNNLLSYSSLIALENKKAIESLQAHLIKLFIIKYKLLSLITWGARRQQARAMLAHLREALHSKHAS